MSNKIYAVITVVLVIAGTTVGYSSGVKSGKEQVVCPDPVVCPEPVVCPVQEEVVQEVILNKLTDALGQ